MVRPVSGSNRVTPATTTNTCSATRNDSPVASSLPNASRTAKPGGDAARDEQRVQHEQRGKAEQPGLLAEGAR